MIWLQTPPWGRWILATLIAATALWIELKPTDMVEHPFASVEIETGEAIDASNTDQRLVPSNLFEPIPTGSIANTPIALDDPVLASDVGAKGSRAPPGQWVVRADVPQGALPGDEVRLVLIDTSETFTGFVVSTRSDDPFADTIGSVAVDQEAAGAVAVAAAEGRLAVLVSTG